MISSWVSIVIVLTILIYIYNDYRIVYHHASRIILEKVLLLCKKISTLHHPNTTIILNNPFKMPLKKTSYLLLHTSKKIDGKNIVTLRSNIYLINSMDIIHDDAQSSLYFPIICWKISSFFYIIHNYICIHIQQIYKQLKKIPKDIEITLTPPPKLLL